MALNPNYCRTCGAPIRSKSVCYNCGCPPLKGNQYCFNCKAATLPAAIICVNCNAPLQKKFPVITAALVVAGIVIASASIGIIISQINKSPSTSIVKTDTIAAADTSNAKSKLILSKKEVDLPKTEIDNKPVIPLIDSNSIRNRILKQQQDTLSRLIRSIQSQQKTLFTPPKKIIAESKKILINVFSAKELDDYTIGCSFFANQKDKSSVVFFYTRSLGYAKINGEIIQVKMIGSDKANGLYKFAGSRYDVSVYIEGLSGTDEEWFASGTISITDEQQGLATQRRIFSSCAIN